MLDWNHSYRSYRLETAGRMPLTISWDEQLLQEAEALLDRKKEGSELAAAVQGLALLLYGLLYDHPLGGLLSLHEEVILRGLIRWKGLSEETIRVLEALDSAEGIRRFEEAPEKLRAAAMELLEGIRGTGKPAVRHHFQ